MNKHPAEMRAERSRAMFVAVAKAYGKGYTWSAAIAIRAMLHGHLEAPPGHQRTVQKILEHYDGRVINQRTIWRALKEVRAAEEGVSDFPG